MRLDLVVRALVLGGAAWAAGCGGGGGSGGGPSGVGSPLVVASATSGTVVLGGGVQTLTTVDVVSPYAGTIVVEAAGGVRHNYTNGNGLSVAEVYLSTLAAGQDNPVESRLPDGLPTGTYGLPFDDIAAIPHAGGTTTIYLNVHSGGSQPVSAIGARLVARLYPTGSALLDAAPTTNASLTTMLASLSEADLTAPAAGRIVVEEAGVLRHDLTATGADAVVSISQSAIGSDAPIEGILPGALPTGLYGFPFGDGAEFAVTAGMQPAHMTGIRLTGPTSSVVEGRLVSRFLPQGATDYVSVGPVNVATAMSVQEVENATINAPVAGFVILRATGMLYHSYTASTAPSVAEVYLSDTATGQDNPIESRLPDTLPTGNYELPFADVAVYPVTAGSHTFHLNSLLSFTSTGQTISVLEARMSLTYFAP